MSIIITLDGRQIPVEPKTTVKEIRVQYEVPAEKNVWKLDAPPKKLKDSYEIQDGDQLVFRTKEQVPE